MTEYDYEAMLDDKQHIEVMLSLVKALKDMAVKGSTDLNHTTARTEMLEVIDGIDNMMHDSGRCGSWAIKQELDEHDAAEEREHERIERAKQMLGVGR